MHMQISLFLRYWNVGRARQAQIVLDKRSHHVWYNKFVHDSILLITNIWTHRFSNLDTFASPHFDLTFLYINLLVEAEVKTSLFMTTSLGQRVCCSCKNYTAMIHWTPHKPGGAFTNQNMKLSNLEPEVWICSFLRFQVGLQGVSTSIQYGNLLLPVHCSTHHRYAFIVSVKQCPGHDGADDIKIDQWHETSSLSSALVADFWRSSVKLGAKLRRQMWDHKEETQETRSLKSLAHLLVWVSTCIHSVSSKVERLLWICRNVSDVR